MVEEKFIRILGLEIRVLSRNYFALFVICYPLSTVKLNGKKIRWIIAQKMKGESTSTIAEIQGISARRVQQIYKEYNETGQIPQVGHNIGRPNKSLSADDKKLIDQMYSDYKFGVCYFEIIIRSKCKRKILEKLEAPQDAFWNRLPIKAKFRIGVRLFGLWKYEKIGTTFKAKLFQDKT